MDPLSSIYPCIFGPGGLTGEEKRNKLTGEKPELISSQLMCLVFLLLNNNILSTPKTIGQKQMTLCNGGFLPFELGEITGKFNHPLEQVSLSLIFTQLHLLHILHQWKHHYHKVEFVSLK